MNVFMIALKAGFGDETDGQRRTKPPLHIPLGLFCRLEKESQLSKLNGARSWPDVQLFPCFILVQKCQQQGKEVFPLSAENHRKNNISLP